MVELATGDIETRSTSTPDWRVGVMDTGRDTQTGGRVKRLEKWIGRERFMCTYGDGLGNVDIAALLRFHESHGKVATLTAVRPPARFGGPYTEETPLVGRFPYDASKSCADLIALSYFHTYRVPIAVTRCGNLFGGGDLNWNRLIPGTI